MLLNLRILKVCEFQVLNLICNELFYLREIKVNRICVVSIFSCKIKKIVPSLFFADQVQRNLINNVINLKCLFTGSNEVSSRLSLLTTNNTILNESLAS